MTSWWKRLLAYARPHGPSLGLITGAMLLGVGLGALRPWPLKYLVDGVFSDRGLSPDIAWLQEFPGAGSDAGLLAWLAGATVLLFLASQIVLVAQGYLQTGVGNRMVFELGADLFEHLQRLSLGYHHKTPRGDLVRRVTTDTRCVRGLVMGVALPVATSLATLFVMFAIMWRLDWQLALVAIAAAGPLVWVVRVLAQPLADREWQYQQAEGAVMSQAERILGSLSVVKIFRGEAREETRFRALANESLTAYDGSLRAQLRFQVTTQGVTAAGAAAIMVVGGNHVLAGSLSIGSLLVFLAYLASLYAPMETLAYLSSGFASAAANARRVFDVLEKSDGIGDSDNAVELPTDATVRVGRITLDHVNFAYTQGVPVVRNVSLEVAPGETVAIVGPTGSGKTTLASLVARLYDPSGGHIAIGGLDLRDVKVASIRANVALVLQDPFLLPVSVAENIAYGDPDATMKRIEAAAIAANADAFVRGLPDGYDTLLGERGATLSVGQRQRLSIARAILKDAPVLILDEPTSALDVHSEAALLRALERLRVGRTTLVIAHRLSTIRSADRIVFLENGRIVECGSHAELMALGGAYHGFYDLQLGETTLSGSPGSWAVEP